MHRRDGFRRLVAAQHLERRGADFPALVVEDRRDGFDAGGGIDLMDAADDGRARVVVLVANVLVESFEGLGVIRRRGHAGRCQYRCAHPGGHDERDHHARETAMSMGPVERVWSA